MAYIKKLTLLALLIPAAFMSYGGCNESNGGDKFIDRGENLFTPVVLLVLDAPVPVKGSDGLYHIVYELSLNNFNFLPWQILKVEALVGGPDGSVLHTVSGEEVQDKMNLFGTRQPTDTLQPAEGALVHLTYAFENKEDIPDSIIHRLTITVPGGLPDSIIEFLELPEGQESITELGAPSKISGDMAVVLGPPLEGSGWVAANGCCDSITHVRSSLPLNGEIFISQRFAIDWLKVNEDNRLYEGDPQVLDNWFGYNQNILAVADAQVVRVVDRFEDQVPFILPAEQGTITLEEIDGNHVILALPNGQFVFYAHLKPGSVTVKEGDFVSRGDVIALLGNTGNTGAPHLHIHVMETASSLGSNGLPYTFSEYVLTGRTTEESFFDDGLEDNTPFIDEETGLIEGTPINVLPVNIPGQHSEDLPLDLRIVEFPEI